MKQNNYRGRQNIISDRLQVTDISNLYYSSVLANNDGLYNLNLGIVVPKHTSHWCIESIKCHVITAENFSQKHLSTKTSSFDGM